MSVEDIQKVNKLAQELLDQGFTDSRETAVQKAQEMLNKEVVSAQQMNEPVQQQSAVQTDSDNLKNMIERTKEQIARQFAGYKNALIALEKEIMSLKEEVSKLQEIIKKVKKNLELIIKKRVDKRRKEEKESKEAKEKEKQDLEDIKRKLKGIDF